MEAILLSIIGLLFINIKNIIFILFLIALSLALSYFKKFYGLFLYSITLIYIVNQLNLENLFSLDGFYTIIFFVIPTFLFLDTLLKKDIKFSIFYFIYLAPLIFAMFGFYELSTFSYITLLLYLLYNRFKYLDKILIIKISLLFVVPIIILYILYVNFPDIFNTGIPQCSVLISISGILLIIYRLKKF